MSLPAVQMNNKNKSSASKEGGRLLMRARNLSKAFGGQMVLNGVDLDLYEGEVVLLRGENGSGKTTLLNILTGNLEPDTGHIETFTNGEAENFKFPRKWWQELNPADHFTPERLAREGVGRTWQDIRLFGTQTLLENLAVARPDQPGENPLRLLASPKSWQKAENDNLQSSCGLLQSLGLGMHKNSSADMMSLGLTKPIAFARASRANTKILFLDEPLAGVDHKGTKDVINVLRELAATHRLTLVIVEHVFNIPIILNFASTVWTLADGKLTKESIAEAKADPSVKNNDSMFAFIQEMAGPDAVITEEPLIKGAILTRVKFPMSSDKVLLSVKDLLVYRRQHLVVGEESGDRITRFNLEAHKGELLFLQAPNGWGKTTLLEALAGLLPCRSGTIQLGNETLDKLPIWQRHSKGLAIVQARANIFNSLTIADYQRISRNIKSKFGTKEMLGDLIMSSLSGGERQRLVLNNANYQGAKVKVWDEPFGSLDTKSARELCHHFMPDAESTSLILLPSKHQLSEKL